MGYKKLDEVMELLNDELDVFSKSIIKLEKLTQNTENIKIKADTSAIEYMLQEHLRAEKEKNNGLEEAIQGIEKQMAKSRLIPKVQVWIHYGVYFISLIIIGYLLYDKTQLKKIQENTLAKMEEATNTNLEEYFEQYPEHYQSYQKWLQEQESIPNQK